MKYLTNPRMSAVRSLIDMQSLIFAKYDFASNYPNYNYETKSKTNASPDAVYGLFSPCSRPPKRPKTVHNLCINWQ